MCQAVTQDFATDKRILPLALQYGPQKGTVRIIIVFIHCKDSFTL